MFKCVDCGKQVKTKRGLNVHTTRMHGEVKRRFSLRSEDLVKPQYIPQDLLRIKLEMALKLIEEVKSALRSTK